MDKQTVYLGCGGQAEPEWHNIATKKLLPIFSIMTCRSDLPQGENALENFITQVSYPIRHSDITLLDASKSDIISHLELIYSRMHNKYVISFDSKENIDKSTSLFCDQSFITLDEAVTHLLETSVSPKIELNPALEQAVFYIQDYFMRYFSKEDIQHPYFRLSLTSSQLGSVSHSITHSYFRNPTSRRIGSREDEVAQNADLFWQTICLAFSQNISLLEAFNTALIRSHHLVWKDNKIAQKLVYRDIKPTFCISEGTADGLTARIERKEDISTTDSGRVIVNVFPEVTSYIAESIIEREPIGYLTPLANLQDHMSIRLREAKIPALAIPEAQNIPNNALIHLDATKEVFELL